MGDEPADFDRLSAGILAGRGVVARYPGVVCVADAAGAEPVRALVALCAAVAGFEPGRPLARRLAAWLSGPDAPPSSLRFGTLADAGDRWAVFLSGAVSLHDAGTDATIPGADAAAWTDRLVTPGGPLVLCSTRSDEERPQGRADDVFADLHDLRAGTVPGRGVVLATASAARHTAMPPLPAPASAPRRTRRPHRPRLRPPLSACRAGTRRLSSGRAASTSRLSSGRAATRRAGTSRLSPGRATTRRAAASRLGLSRAAARDELGRARRRCTPSPRRAVGARRGADRGDGRRRLGPAAIPPAHAPRSRRSGRRAGRRSSTRRPRPSSGPRSAGRRCPRPRPDGPATTAAADRATATTAPSSKAAAPGGHLCARGHLNDPRSHFCVLCGIRMNERTGELVFGPRPPLGLLVFDDGATYTVDAEYLVGRMPDVDERVRNGSLRSIVVEDRSGAVSRVHAEVRVDGWDVMLVDSRSRNGTHIAGPGANAWTTVPPGRSTGSPRAPACASAAGRSCSSRRRACGGG